MILGYKLLEDFEALGLDFVIRVAMVAAVVLASPDSTRRHRGDFRCCRCSGFFCRIDSVHCQPWVSLSLTRIGVLSHRIPSSILGAFIHWDRTS